MSLAWFSNRFRRSRPRSPGNRARPSARPPAAVALPGAAVLLALLAVAPASAQEPAVIQGRVTGPAGEGLNSAQVSIAAYNVGTITGTNGEYVLTVPAARLREGDVELQARLLGYRAQTATVTLRPGARVQQDFVLELDPIRLEEIVATGQGTQQLRRRLGSTVSTVSAEEVVGSQESNVVAGLAGKAPNVEVTSQSGEPAAGAYIRIRGANTLTGSNQPLFVVDGTPISNASNGIEGVTATEGQNLVLGTAIQNRAADLNPEDIESIEILKGPAASAIYGAAGANGAVLITTKSGARNAPVQATLKTSFSVDEVSQLPDLQTRFSQGILCVEEVAAALGCAPGVDEFFDVVSWGLPIEGETVYDHASEVFETGSRFNGDLTLSGGTDQTTWYLSGGWQRHNGVIVGPNSELDRLTTRLKGSQMFRDNLTVGGNVAYTKQKGGLVQQGSNTSGLLLGAFRTPPEYNNCPTTPGDVPCYIDPETGLHRSYRNPSPTSLTAGRGYDNPFWVAFEMPNRTDVDRTFGNVRADWDPFEWLTVQYTLGADYYTDQRMTLFPKSSSTFPNGHVIRADLSEFNVDHSLLLTGTHALSEDVTGTLTVGQNLRHEEFSRYQVNGDQLIFGAGQLDFAVSRIPNEFQSTVRTEGYFATADLDLYDQLFLSGGVRVDASSTFGGEEVRRFAYPRASAAWEFTQLEPLAGSSVLDYGKLRLAYGVAGKAPPVFSNVTGFTTTTITDGWILPLGLETIYQGNEGVVREIAIGNEEIDPERTWEIEGGIDLAFFDGRVSTGVTHYYQKTDDAILFLPTAPSIGFFSQPVNGAEYRNDGWEVTLDVSPVRSSNFRWDVSAQWATNNSEVLDLLSGEAFFLAGFTGSSTNVVADICGPTADQPCPFGVLFGADFVRFGRGSTVGGVSIDEAFSGWSPGDLYIGPNGFPLQDPQERVIGDPNPDWTGSLRNTVTVLDNLRLSGLIDIKKGGDMWNGTKGALMFFGTHAFTEPMQGAGSAHVFGCGEPALGQVRTCENPSGVAGPGVGQPVTLNWATWTLSGIGSGFVGPSSQDVEDSGFVKLRDVSASYTFDQDWVRKIGGASRIEVSASGRNLKTWTDYTGIDPESNLTGQSAGRGLEYFNNPQTRSFVFTVSITR